MGVLEEAQVCTSYYAFVVRVQMYVDNLLMVGSSDCDGGWDSNFNRCVNGGQHCVCLGVCQENDKVSKLGGVVLADMRDYVCSVGCGQ